MFEKEAEEFCKSLSMLTAEPDKLSNLKSYLTIHFDSWLKHYADTPEGLVSEIKAFASMDI